MRNMRSALWALGLAGATYAWRNRERLQQQWSQRGFGRRQQQLPDYGSGSGQPQSSWNQPQSQTSWDQPRERQFGGHDV